MRPHDILTNQQINSPSSRKHCEKTEQKIKSTWGVNTNEEEYELDEDDYKSKLNRLIDNRSVCSAHLRLMTHYMHSKQDHVKKKATPHLNEIKLLLIRTQYTIKLLTSFKKPTPPFHQSLIELMEEIDFWRGVEDFISLLSSGERPPGDKDEERLQN